ncbi:MAG: hypothetical protein NTW95_14030 [Candidatus Aminicenantes bacterium]|nr:hypothetical protein [Candidatus Aminicenantes bacterium]
MKLPKFKKPTKKTVGLAIFGLALLVASILYFSLPGITENILSTQAEKFGLKNLQFRAIHVGWRRLDLGDITVGDPGNPSLRIPYLSLEYSLAGLWQKKIRNVRLVGAWIKIEDLGQGFKFQGMTAQPPQAGRMITVERLSLEDGRVCFAWAGRSLEVPVNVTLRASGPDYVLAATLRPLAETVRLQGTVDKTITAGKIAFVVPGFPLQALIDQTGFGSAAWAKGRIVAKGEIILGDGNFKTAAVSVSALGELRLATPEQASVFLDFFSLAFIINSGFRAQDIVASIQGRQLQFEKFGVEAPFHLDIQSRQWPDLEFSIRDLEIVRPLPVAVERITGKISGPWAAAQINGSFRLHDGKGMLAALGLPAEIAQPYAVDGDFQGSLKTGKIAWTMQARGQGRLAVAMGQDSLRGRLNLNAALSGDAQRLHASAACRMLAAVLQLAGYRAQAESLGGDAEVDYDYGGRFHGRGLVTVSGGRVSSGTDDGLAAAGISLKMPWQWPGGGAGGFSVARVQSNGMRWQDISGILTQKDSTLKFSGLMHSALARIVLTFQGQWSANRSAGSLQADFQVPPVVLPAGTALQPLHPMLQQTSGSGRFQAEGRIWAGNDSPGGMVIVKIANADFDQPKEGIALRGVNGSITLDRLFDFVTAPAQRIAFRELKWQDMSFTNGELVFAGEGGNLVFIESGRFDWCQGKIIVAPFRLEAGGKDFLMTFYCDRVNFAQMLNALLGKTTVSGDAEMNGIVPVKMVKGSPVFLDGYLYSTPGRSGNLKVAKPELRGCSWKSTSTTSTLRTCSKPVAR